MAAAAGEAIGLPAASAPTIWLAQLGLAVGADRTLRQVVSEIQPREHGIAHVGMMSDSDSVCRERPPAVVTGGRSLQISFAPRAGAS